MGLTAKVQGHNAVSNLFEWLNLDADGNLIPADTTLDFSGAGAVSRVVNIGPSRLVEIFGRNLEAGTVYLMIFDAAAVPANGTAPDISPIELLAGQSFSLTTPPALFTAGLTWAVSTTDTTLTISVGLGATVSTWFR